MGSSRRTAPLNLSRPGRWQTCWATAPVRSPNCTTSKRTPLVYMGSRTALIYEAYRYSEQKPTRKFCRSKEDKMSETHPEKPEKGETGCVLGAGEGSSGWRRMRPGEKPGVRTKVNTITMQHVQKENRRKPSVFAGFVAGAEGLVSAVASVGPGRSPPGCRPPRHAVLEWMWESALGERGRGSVARFSRTSPKRVVLVWCSHQILQPFDFHLGLG